MNDIIFKILLFLCISFFLFAIVFYIIKAFQACCRIYYKYIIDGKYENEPTEVLEELSPYLMTEYPGQSQEDSFMFSSFPPNSSLITPVSTEEQFPPMESSQFLNLTNIPRLSALHQVNNSLHHNDDPPSYEEAMRMSMKD